MGEEMTIGLITLNGYHILKTQNTDINKMEEYLYR